MKSTALFAGLTLVAVTAFGGDGTIRRSAQRIPGQYIVVLESGSDVASVAGSLKRFAASKVTHQYQKGIKGLAVQMTEADAQQLALDPRVQFVEEDASFNASTTWALDRIDQRYLPLNGSYVSDGSGAGVSVYVVDTGILATHNDFSGRVTAGFTAFQDGRGSTDCNGHGTHVAGAIAGSEYGAAKAATLVPVRVLDCNGAGSLSTVLAGLEWILADQQRSPRPAVVNMSLGGRASSTLDQEVALLLAAGLTTVVAAGNNNDDACAYSPARVQGAITVAATNGADRRTTFSNYGACVDVSAPGAGIVSAWHTGPSATSVLSGTSAAAPFVAGVAALLLERYPAATPGAVAQTIVNNATSGVVTELVAGTPNRLLFSLVTALDDAAESDGQLLSDPGFDYGTTFWTSGICDPANPVACPPGDVWLDGSLSGGSLVDSAMVDAMSLPSRSRNTHAALGGSRPPSSQITSEVITIPQGVTRAELSFYLWILTTGNGQKADDFLHVRILDANGGITTLGTFSNLDRCSTYLRRGFDLTQFIGKPVRISFDFVQGKGSPTLFVLDDASVNIWK